MEIFNNIWVVTVLGGIAVTVIGSLIDELITRFRSKVNVKKSNENIVEFLTNLYINKASVDKSMIDMIKDSYARKYSVKEAKLSKNIQYLSDVLVRVYETQHLSIDDKNNISSTIKDTINKFEIYNFSLHEELIDKKNGKRNYILATYSKNKDSTFYVIYLLLLSLIFTFGGVYIVTIFGINDSDLKFDESFLAQTSTMIAITALILSTSLSYLRLIKSRKAKYKKENELLKMMNNKKIQSIKENKE